MTLASPIQPPQADSGMTYGELLLEVAARCGMVVYPDDGTAATLPNSSTEEYRQLASAFHRGYSRFLRRREWTFLNRDLELTLYPNGDGPYNLDGDASRYRIPHWARAIPVGRWYYTDEQAGITFVCMRDVEEVRHNIAMNTGSGTPVMAGIGPMQARGGTGDPATDWELLLWPKPSIAYRIRATFRLNSHKLVSHEQRHIAGAEHDEAILCEAIWAKYESDVASPERDGAKLARDEAIADSIRIDVATTVGLKGVSTDSGIPNRGIADRLWTPDVYVNGVLMDRTP